MTQTEALKLALEALEECRRDPRLRYEHPAYDKTITAIKEALAQPEQEPVVEIEFLDWVHPKLGVTKVEVEGGKPLILKAKIKFQTSDKCPNCASLEDELERTRIKAAVWKSAYDVEVGCNEQDTTPPQRTWVGLNDDDKKQIAKAANYNWEMTTGEYAERIGRLTEAKLKEKNT